MDLRPIWIAGRFLTRLPFPEPRQIDPWLMGLSVPWYPLIGLLLGLLIAVAGIALARVDAGVAAVLVLILWVWSSGALHLDGLADSADAWVGGLASRERTLEIMKDPRSGPAAITAIVLVLLGKWAGLQALFTTGLENGLASRMTSGLASTFPGGAIWLLLVIPLLTRAQLPLLMLTTPYARAHGMASDQMAQLPRPSAWAAILATGVAAILLAGWIGILLCTTAGLIFWLSRRAMLRRLGGFSGDTAGALVEITETLLLLGVVVVVH